MISFGVDQKGSEVNAAIAEEYQGKEEAGGWGGTRIKSTSGVVWLANG
jgi:hypothetical protein